MRTTYISLLVISCCLLALPNTYANQAEQLQRLIKSGVAPVPLESYTWANLDANGLHFSPVYIGPQDGLMEKDRISALPGQPKDVDFAQYGGYVTIDPKKGRSLFYYFVESQNSSTKPLVLWLNGGPGCSSLGYGAMEEVGPFRVNSDGETLGRNNYAWSNVANVLFLESPAGVGFSYTNITEDKFESGDTRTAEDSYTFLINWLERFPQYKNRDFFITGESYAGHYVPQLASLILNRNKSTNQTVINLRGIAIGNAYVDNLINTEAIYEFIWSHALISDETYDKIRSNCNFSAPNSECNNAMNEADTGNIDDYNIYAPTCHSYNSMKTLSKAFGDFDPCSNNYVESYLNDPAVQKALHAISKTKWQFCSLLNWIDRPETVLPIIKQLTSTGLSVWLYSGDTDAVVPVTSTRHAIQKLGLPVSNSWRPWYSNYEVGGYVVEYKGLVMATVRGAGHMVPSYQPERALTMISSFLQGKLPPAA